MKISELQAILRKMKRLHGDIDVKRHVQLDIDFDTYRPISKEDVWFGSPICYQHGEDVRYNEKSLNIGAKNITEQ